MSGIPLQTGIVYGPILSRRLGRSLGINLLPRNKKVCSFDCVYCQYGPTEELTLSPKREILPSVDDVLVAVESALKKPRTIDYLTFSGNGEPTIHPDFPEIICEIKTLKQRLRPDAKLAILSNASMVTNSDVISALSMVDRPMMKLDVGNQGAFNAINHPVMGLNLSDIITGLHYVQGLIIQSVLIDGEFTNIDARNYDNWVQVLRELEPVEIQIYSSERPTALNNVKCVPPQKLKRIEEDLRVTYGLNCVAYWRS